MSTSENGMVQLDEAACESESESLVVKEEEQQSGGDELVSELETVMRPGRPDVESEDDEVESEEESDPDTVTSGGTLESVDDVLESAMGERRGRLSKLDSAQTESSSEPSMPEQESTIVGSRSSSLNSVSESDSYSESASSGSVSS